MEQILKLRIVMKCLRRILMSSIIGQIIATPFNTLASIPNKQPTIDFYAVREVRPNTQPSVTADDLFNHVLPPISPTNDGLALMKQVEKGIPQKWTDEILNSNLFKKTPVGQATTKVEETMKQSVSVTTPSFSAAPPVTHTFNVNVRVWEQRALLKYTGFFTSEMTYDHTAKNINTAIVKSLSDSTTLSLVNTSPVGDIDKSGQVVLTYNF